jgi:hypothetical protein
MYDPAGPTSGSAINVDVTGLRQFADSIEGQAERGLRPEVAALMAVYGYGSHFGLGHNSADVHAARTRHTDCLRAAAQQLSGYVEAVQILVGAAREVSARYRDTDALAASNSHEVEQALAAAVRSATRAQADASPPPATAPRDTGGFAR